MNTQSTAMLTTFWRKHTLLLRFACVAVLPFITFIYLYYVVKDDWKDIKAAHRSVASMITARWVE